MVDESNIFVRIPPVSGGGGPKIRYGNLATAMAAKQLEPAAAVSERLFKNVTKSQPQDGCMLVDNFKSFYAVNPWNVALEQGVFVACTPGTKNVWVIIQADCPEDPPPPPNGCCYTHGGSIPDDVLSEGQCYPWDRVGDPLFAYDPIPCPPPPPCVGDPPACSPGQHAECISGQWQCVDDGPPPPPPPEDCPPPTPDCGPGAHAECHPIQGGGFAWVCVPD